MEKTKSDFAALDAAIQQIGYCVDECDDAGEDVEKRNFELALRVLRWVRDTLDRSVGIGF